MKAVYFFLRLLQEDKKRIKLLEAKLTRAEKALGEIRGLLMLSPTFPGKWEQ